MKKCLFCAEEIQDEAIACKHCGRDLHPAVNAVAGKNNQRGLGGRRFIWIGVAVLVALVFVRAIVEQTTPQGGSGKCVLHARAAVVTRNAPIARVLNWDTDVLAIRSGDHSDWKDLEVTVFGFVTTGASGKRPTGPYRRKRDLVSAGELTAFNLKDFEKANGERWVSLTMSVDDIELKASMRGESCAAEISPNASVAELSVR